MSKEAQDIWKILNDIAKSHAESNTILAELRNSQLKSDVIINELRNSQLKTDAQLAKTSKKLDAVAKQLGDIGHSNGDAAESFFFNSLEEKKAFGNVKFDTISQNVHQKRHRMEDEYDIFLENGNAVGIIEVKYKVQKHHIEKLLDKKASNFRTLFPDYDQYKLYIGIAGLSFDPIAEQYAQENGIVVLKQKGEVVEINSSQMRAF